MSEIWHVFGKGELQELIGLSTLERLGVLLPALMKDGADPDVIHYKETLCRIFESFAGPAAFLDREFRHRFLNHLTSQQIDRLIRETGTQVSGQGFEEKVSALVARGWSDPGFCEKVAACLGLPEEFVPHLPSQVPSELVFPAALRPFKTLKDYQSAVFHVAEKRMAAPNARFVLQMPTGSGKTRTAMELVTQLLNRADERTVVVWLAHAKELCEQAYECFLEVWGHVGASPVRVLRCWGPNSALTYDFNDKALVIGGFQKLQSLLTRNAVPFDELRNRVALIVVDEAHKVLAPTYSTVTHAFRGDSSRIVGLTATPGRSTLEAGENAALAEFFFNQIVTIPAGEEGVIAHLRKRRVLAEAQYEPLTTDLKFELSSRERAHLEHEFDLPEGVLRRIGTDDVRNLEILKRLQRECERASSILFFGCSVEHSRFICANLIFLGVRAAHLDGATPSGQRDHLIAEFRRGALQVLCNYGVLSTGFDAPKTDVVFISRPTASIVLYSQMIGRGLRGPAIGGTEVCKIIDVKDNIIGYADQSRTYDYFKEYFEGSERLINQ